MSSGRRIGVVVVAAALGCVAAALPGTSADAATRPLTATSADRALDRALTAFVQARGGPPSIVAVVQRADEPVLHAAGEADIATGAAPRIDDFMRLASVAKAFSGAAATSLVADGLLSLDDTVGEHLPELPATWARITLAQLLGHTSGIPDFSATKAFQAAVGASLAVAPPPVDLLSFVFDDPLDFTPGSQYRYSNSDNVVVGLMVAAITGSTYEEQLALRVYQPLALVGTSLPSGPTLPEPRIHGYVVDPPAAPDDVTELFAAGWAWASGGVVSTPGDATRFVRGYVSGATTDPATHDAQFRFRRGTSEPPGPGTNAAGLAVFRYRTRCGTVFGHTGNTPGYTQFIAATADGSRSVTVSVGAQITPSSDPERFKGLRTIFTLGACAALART